MTDRLGPDSPILALHTYALGDTEVPPAFHFYAMVTTIAACVADRVGVEKMPGKRLVPNLYTVLVGPSALGKGEAIEAAAGLVSDLDVVNVYNGRVTAASLIDKLGRVRKRNGVRTMPNPKLFLVAEELAMSVHGGPLAVDLFQVLTKLYAGTAVPLQEMTRTRGEVTITKPCVNVLAGTTQEWMVRAIPPEMIEGGLLSRLLIVEAPYNFTKRIATPMAPTDRQAVLSIIRDRLRRLTEVTGTFQMTGKALDMREAWYATRPTPADQRLASWWKREDDLILKLAMVTALSRGDFPVLNDDHLVAARRLTGEIAKWVRRALEYTAMTPETRGAALTADIIRRNGTLSRSTLTRRLYDFGYSGEQVEEFTRSLTAMQKIRALPTGPRGGISYLWMERRRLDPTNNGSSPEEETE